MIAYNFAYYQPSTIQEATEQYETLREQHKKVVYLSGGTEIITLGRANKIVADAVIDMKNIPECKIFEKDRDQLILGAALPLTMLEDKPSYPLLQKIIAEIADHTARNKITLGGNICANIIYREAVLPLMLTDSKVVIATVDGLREKSINEIFDEKLILNEGELLVQVKIDVDAIDLPFFTVKKRRQWGVGYPLITIAAIEKEGEVKTAFSGLCSYPFLGNQQIEETLNNQTIQVEDRVEQAIQYIPDDILNDIHGSDEYRMFVLKNVMTDAMRFFDKGGRNEWRRRK